MESFAVPSFSIEPPVVELGVSVECFVIKGLDNSTAEPEFDALFQKEIDTIKSKLSEDQIQSNQILNGFRVLHEKIGKTGKRWTSSPENLQRMLLATSSMPNVNKLVNIYNLVSLQTNLALGAHDLDHIEGNVSLRLTTGTEKFWPIGAKQPEKIAEGEYGYCDQANEVICRMEVRQVEKTKVLPHTKNVFFIVQGNQYTSDDYIANAVDRLAQLVMRYAGGIYEQL